MRCAPGVILLFLAFALSFLVSISAPYITDFDDVRVFLGSPGVTGTSSGTPTGALGEIRFGIWGYCARTTTSSSESCAHDGLAYQMTLAGPNGVSQAIKPSWTRGLVMSPVATGFIFLAFLASLSEHLGVLLVASLLSFMGALVTLIFMIIDIVLFIYIRNRVKKLGVSENTNFGPGFWMSLGVFILCLLAGFLVCFGRRRERNANRADNYVARPVGTTGYGARPTGFRRFLPGRKY